MQQELITATPASKIRILGINNVGSESGNPTITNGRDIPWLQDTVDVQVWSNWQVRYRDVFILDENNVLMEIYNLTEHNLTDPSDYAELKRILKYIAGELCNSFGDSDKDGICNDGDNSGISGDNPCIGDETIDCDDNCPDTPNGWYGGMCYSWSEITTCTTNSDCDPDSFCTMNQEDNYPPQGNGCGDACECEGNFDGDEDQDGTDATIFKAGFGRQGYDNPCSDVEPCNGNFDCDDDVDGADAFIFKSDFGRGGYNNPCPVCITEPWCVYP